MRKDKKYNVQFSYHERRVIKNILNAKIQEFYDQIDSLKMDTTSYHDIEIVSRREWIKNYRQLIKKLDNALAE